MKFEQVINNLSAKKNSVEFDLDSEEVCFFIKLESDEDFIEILYNFNGKIVFYSVYNFESNKMFLPEELDNDFVNCLNDMFYRTFGHLLDVFSDINKIKEFINEKILRNLFMKKITSKLILMIN